MALTHFWHLTLFVASVPIFVIQLLSVWPLSHKREVFYSLVGCCSSVSGVCACFTLLTTVLPLVTRLACVGTFSPVRKRCYMTSFSSHRHRLLQDTQVLYIFQTVCFLTLFKVMTCSLIGKSWAELFIAWSFCVTVWGTPMTWAASLGGFKLMHLFIAQSSSHRECCDLDPAPSAALANLSHKLGLRQHYSSTLCVARVHPLLVNIVNPSSHIALCGYPWKLRRQKF